MSPLDGSQTRQLVDSTQLYLGYRTALREAARFKGSMAWKTVSGHQYLYRKTGGIWTSLGPRNAQTEQTFDRFKVGKAEAKARHKSLAEEVERVAPINRAMRLGRVPFISARLLRRLDAQGLLGHGLRVAGTHALYAYEMIAGAHFSGDHVATMDIDLLLDARSSLKFVSSELRRQGLVGMLQSIDPSFHATEPGSFRAANDKGFLVDLITPTPKGRATSKAARPLGDDPEDLRPVEIEGLSWLENSPAIEQVAIDERGFPLVITAPDPRAFVAHKLWVSRRDDREPVKRRRDAAQARAVARMLAEYAPHLSFDDPALGALPDSLRTAAKDLAAEIGLLNSLEAWR